MSDIDPLIGQPPEPAGIFGYLRRLHERLYDLLADILRRLLDLEYTIEQVPPWFDVRLYGAKGDGTTNDTAAIARAQAAAAAVGGILYFPEGTYLTSPFTVACAGIIGSGRWTTAIKIIRTTYAAGAIMIDFTGNTNAPVMHQIGLDINDAVFDVVYGIQLSCSYATVGEVRIYGRSNIALITRAGAGCLISDVVGDGQGATGLQVGVYADGTSTRLTVRDFVHMGFHNYAVNISSGSFNTIENCYSDTEHSTTGSFAFCLADCSYSIMKGNRSWNSRVEAFNVTRSSYCQMVDNRADWDATHGVDFGLSIAGGDSTHPASYNTVRGNVIHNSYKSGIAIADEARYNLVSDNELHDCGVREEAAGGVGTSTIGLYTAIVGATCSNNRLSDNQLIATTGAVDYGISEAGGTVAATLMDRNTIVGATTPYNIASATSKVVDHEWYSWTPTVTNTGGGGFTYTVNRARYQRDGKSIKFSLAVTVTAAGGGGYVNVTLPFNGVAGGGGGVAGIEDAVTGFAIQGSVGVGGINQIRTYNNGATAVLNYKLNLNGVYEAA